MAIVLVLLGITVPTFPDQAGAAIPSTALAEFPIPTPNSGSVGIAAGPDGNLWFTEFNQSQIGQITPSGVVTEFRTLTGQSGPKGITAGPDGNLWFTETNVNAPQIGRMTPARGIREFPLPTGSSPLAITAGPDGNLWFTEQSGAIDRVTTAGALLTPTLFPVGFPQDITAGPDGNLWFTDLFTDSSPPFRAIGQINPTTGAVQEFPPTGNLTNDPGAITAGPDGNLWFTESTAAQIGRITPTGAITEFPIPSGDFAQGITAGPDGNLWFTAGSTGIGQITTTGTVTEIFTPRIRTQPQGITVGPDQNIWFTESGGNQIGRITLPPRDLSLPAISGTATSGQTLVTSTGSWSNAPSGFTYQWQQCTPAGDGCTPISGATGSSYVPTAADVGHTLVAVVTASNAGGASAPVASAAVPIAPIIVPPAPAPAPAPGPTATAVVCSPSVVAPGESTTCTATVTDVSGAATPTGIASFSDSGPGAFGSAGGCLVSGSGASASCSVKFTPSAIGSGSDTVLASYGGDSAHLPSSGSGVVRVIPLTKYLTSITAVCSPGTLTVGRPTSCTATVTGASGASNPRGSVSFATVSPGVFKPGSRCTLLANGGQGARCTVSFTPAKATAKTITITIAYLGDDAYVGAGGFTTVAFPPVAGVTGNVKVLQGTVVILSPGATRARIASASGAAGSFVPLKGSTVAVPMGSTIDARKGTLRLTTAADYLGSLERRHQVQSGTFSVGMFVVKQLTVKQQLARQKSKRRPLGVPATRLLLTNPANAPQRARCRRSGAPGKGVVRQFHGVAKGLYETVGSASTATVRNALWNVQDRCDGTLTEVGRGKVTVQFVAHAHMRTATVRAGQAYFVMARFLEAKRVSKGIGPS